MTGVDNTGTTAASKSGNSAAEKTAPKQGNGNGSHKPHFVKPLLLLLVVAAIGAFVFFQINRNRPEGKPGWMRINGRIEGYEVNVGAKIAGRVEFISNREGEEVKRGQLLVKLSDEDIQAQLRGAKARYQEALRSVQEAEEQLKVSKQQVQ